jgi:hypothetical protein
LSEQPKQTVEILDVKDITTYPKLNQPTVTHAITYRAGADQVPRTIFIPEADDTPENRAKAIKDDIARIKGAPTTIEV